MSCAHRPTDGHQTRGLGQPRRELHEFLPRQGIDVARFRLDADWSEFRSALMSVLENQPLSVRARYGLNIAKITFLPSHAGRYKLLVDFRVPITGADCSQLQSLTLDGAY